MSYSKLAKSFISRSPYKYNNQISFDGTKIIGKDYIWKTNSDGSYRMHMKSNIVLAEWINHKGKDYSVVYNRGNKCYATEIVWLSHSGWRSKVSHLKYGELGKPSREMQLVYKPQMIDKLIYLEAVEYILLPRTIDGDSAFFEQI